jgi:hypothetical protein
LPAPGAENLPLWVCVVDMKASCSLDRRLAGMLDRSGAFT